MNAEQNDPIRPFIAGGLLDQKTITLQLNNYILSGNVLTHKHALTPAKQVSTPIVRLLQACLSGEVETCSSEWRLADIAAVLLSSIARFSNRKQAIENNAGLTREIFPQLHSSLRTEDQSDQLIRLSNEGLALASNYANPSEIGRFLYQYGHKPLTLKQSGQLSDRDATSKWLGIDKQPPWLDNWKKVNYKDSNGWNLWQLKNGPIIDSRVPLPKLYVSPNPQYLPDALKETCLAATKVGLPVFKVGSNAHAVTRPDKLVVYAPDYYQLNALMVALIPKLDGMKPQGVPFTCAALKSGLISWAQDLPTEPGFPRLSWRQHVTEILSYGIKVAQSHYTENIFWKGRKEGNEDIIFITKAWALVNDINPITWTPLADIRSFPKP